MMSESLTDIVEKFVALVKNEDLQVVHWNMASLCKVKSTAWSSNDDMRRVQTLEKFDLLILWLTTIDDLSADLVHELGEALKFVFDLVGQFTSVAQDEGTAGLWILRDDLESSENKDGGLSHTGHGLTKNILTEFGDWDASLLDIGWMFKTTVGDGLRELGLELHVLEAGGVDASVGSWLGVSSLISVFVVLDKVLEDVFFVIEKFSGFHCVSVCSSVCK